MNTPLALTALRDEVEKALNDTNNQIWSTSLLDRAISQALREVSRAAPRLATADLTLTDEKVEYDISATVSRYLGMAAIWYPWDPTDAGYPEYPIPFFHVDQDTIRLSTYETVDSSYKARLLYWTEHTINGLDGATSSTLDDPWLEELVIEGAAAHAIEIKAADTINTINTSAQAPVLYRQEAERRLRLFYAKLAIIRRQYRTPFAPGWKLDKWDSAYT